MPTAWLAALRPFRILYVCVSRGKMQDPITEPLVQQSNALASRLAALTSDKKFGLVSVTNAVRPSKAQAPHADLLIE